MSKPRKFYEAHGLNVEVYDEFTKLLFGADSEEASFYRGQAMRHGEPVLELGVGTGRIAWALAEAGMRVVGLDLSQPMLDRAEAKRDTASPAASERIRFEQGDMVDFDLGEVFSLVIIPFRSFQIVTTPRDQRRCLRCIHRHLRPDGRLIIDLFDPRLDFCLPDASPQPSDLGTVRHPAKGNSVRIERARLKTDPVTQVFTERWRFSETDDMGEVLRVEEEVFTMRWTYRQEMRYLLELTGFEVVDEFSDYAQAPPAYGKEQIWIARRP